MSKVLTGQMIYEALNALVETGQYCIDEENIAPAESQIYPDLADKLNQELGLVKDPKPTLDLAIRQLKALGYIYLPQAYAGTPVQWKVFKTLDGKLETCYEDKDVFNLLKHATSQGGD